MDRYCIIYLYRILISQTVVLATLACNGSDMMTSWFVIIYPSQSIRDGAALLSTGGSFELGFFSRGSSKNRHMGLWYKECPRTVIWVANREVPLSITLGALNISSEGILVLYCSTYDIVYGGNLFN
ncbi:hypothetical protein POPTR_011G125101v4 [Populus trichocarpa]|uniref:Uncharacterized protein n=1 Tax=Populus trichocarpa TaxID=3694 RepID=A0ACC0S932_POPTR|nr:hypothetical protein POPTR_011G125101v4 [Populus trichocarpa]